MEENEKKCSMFACTNIAFASDSVPFYPFPSDYGLCVKWIQECRRIDLVEVLQENGSIYINEHYHVCSEHFDPSNFKDPEQPDSGLMDTAMPEFDLPHNDCRRYQLAVESHKEINFIIQEVPPPEETFVRHNPTITVLPKTPGLIPVIHVMSPSMLPMHLKHLSSKNVLYHQQIGHLSEGKMMLDDNILYPNSIASDSPLLQDVPVHPSPVFSIEGKPPQTVLYPAVPIPEPEPEPEDIPEEIQMPEVVSISLPRVEPPNFNIENIAIISEPIDEVPETVPEEIPSADENEDKPVEIIESAMQTKVLKPVFLKPASKPCEGTPVKIVTNPIKPKEPGKWRGYKCAMPNCKNYSFSKNSPEFHFFPADTKICSRWVNKCKSEEIEQVFKEKGAKFMSDHIKYMMCSNHFSNRWFKNPNGREGGLRPEAYPDIIVERVKKAKVKTNMEKPGFILGKESNGIFDFGQKILEGACRTCLCTDKPMVDVSDYTLVQIQAVVNSFGLPCDIPNLPMTICIYCHAEFIKIEKFKKQIIEVHKIFNYIFDYKAMNNMDMVQNERKLLCYPSLSFSPTLHVDAPKSDMKCSEMILYSVVNRKKIYHGDILLAKLQYWQKRIDNSRNKRIKVVDYSSTSNPDGDSLIKEELIFHKDCVGNHGDEDDEQSENSFDDDDILNENEDEIFSDDSDVQPKQKKVKIRYTPRNEYLPEWGFQRKSCMNVESEYYTVTRMSKDEAMQQRQEALQAEEYVNAEFKCSYCIKAFSYEDSYRFHMNRHLKNGPYQCEICHRYLQRRTHVIAHCKQHYLRFNCKMCEYKATYRFQLMEHFATEHGVSERVYPCRYCGKIFLKRHNMYLHCNTYHSQETPCDECGKLFKSTLSARVHKRKYHSSKVFECNQCSKTFRYPSQLKSHEKVHSPNRDYYCVECDKHFKTFACLKTHLQTSSFHVDTDRLKYECPTCFKKFPLKVRLIYHMMKHDAIDPQRNLTRKNYHCKVCNKIIGTLPDLRLHYEEQHPGLDPPYFFPCKICNRVFTTNTNLQKHALIHTGEKPFKCTECNKKFPQKASLALHLRMKHEIIVPCDKSRKIPKQPESPPTPEPPPPQIQIPEPCAQIQMQEPQIHITAQQDENNEVKILVEAPQYFYESSSGVIFVSNYETAEVLK